MTANGLATTSPIVVRRWPLAIALALATLTQAACLGPVQVRTAKPLAAGENEVGASISGAWAARSAANWYTGTDTNRDKRASGQGWLSALPEFTYRRGFGGDFDAGARVGGSGGLMEAEASYRFWRRPMAGGELHLASGVQGGQYLASAVDSGRVVVPLRATLDVAQLAGGMLSVTGALHGGYRWVGRGQISPTQAADIIENTRWTLGSNGLLLGGGALVDWRDDVWALGIACTVDHWSGLVGAAGREQTSYGITAVQGAVTASWRWGKDAATLKKAADDLDSLTRQPAP